MQSKRITLYLLCLPFFLFTPMTKGQLILRASKSKVALAAAASTFSGAFAHYMVNSSLTTSLSLSAMTAIAGAWYAYKATPEYKLKRAQGILNQILHSCEYNIAQDCQTTELLLPRIKKYYIRFETPFVSAFNDLRDICEQVDAAQSLLTTAQRKIEWQSSSNAHAMDSKIENHLEELQKVKKHVHNAMQLLKEDPLWVKQLKVKYAQDAADAANRAAEAAEDNTTANTVNAAANVANALKHKD